MGLAVARAQRTLGSRYLLAAGLETAPQLLHSVRIEAKRAVEVRGRDELARIGQIARAPLRNA